MAVSTYVGSFTANATTGNQSITGLGFQPKAVIFWATITSVVGGNNEMRSTFGCATSSTTEWCTHAYHNQGGLTSGCEFTSDRCFQFINGADDSSVSSASFASMDADGFTITMNVASSTSYTVNFMAIGGSSISAQSGYFDVPNSDGPVSVTGLSFNPKATLFAFGPADILDNPKSDAMLGIGWGLSPTQAAASNLYGSVSSNGTNMSAQIQSVGHALVRVADIAVRNMTGTYQNDTAGFTVTIDQYETGAFRVGYLALGGSAGFSTYRFNEPSSTGSRTYSAVGVTPQAALFMTNGNAAAGDGIQADMRRSFGAAAMTTVGTSTSDPPANRIFNEQFSPLGEFGTGVDSSINTTVTTGAGGSTVMRVAYVGGDMGSERVLYTYAIPTAQIYSMAFDVYFEAGFDFANGGKMHGFYPSNPVTGGNTVTADSWSARGMWRANGRLQTYIYHQDMGGTYGTVKRNDSFYLQRERWYAFTYIVKVNDYGLYNGYMQIWVDGVLLIDHQDIRFRNVNTTESLINSTTFNTFHGGNDSSYAPRDADGNITTVYAQYDNYCVVPGEWVKPAASTTDTTTQTTVLRRVAGMNNVSNTNAATRPVTYTSALACIGTCGTSNDSTTALADLTAVGQESFTLNWSKVSGNQSEVVALLVGDNVSVQVSATGIGAQGRVGAVTTRSTGSTTLTSPSAATASLGTVTAVGLVDAIGVQVALTGLQATSAVDTTTQIGNARVDATADVHGLEATMSLGEASHFEYVEIAFLPVRAACMAPLGAMVTTTSRFGLSGDWNPADGLPTDESQGSCWLSQQP